MNYKYFEKLRTAKGYKNDNSFAKQKVGKTTLGRKYKFTQQALDLWKKGKIELTLDYQLNLLKALGADKEELFKKCN